MEYITFFVEVLSNASDLIISILKESGFFYMLMGLVVLGIIFAFFLDGGDDD